MAIDTGADLFVDALEQYGVHHLFGNPGTTEVPIIHALEGSGLDYVLGLHEDIAVGMAAGYARTRTYHRSSDESVNPVGVANLHVAPGLAHGLGNLYDAYRGGVPLLVTAGNHRTDVQHKEPVLSGDLVGMAEPFTKWSAEVPSVDALPSMVRRAFRVALTPPTGPVFLSLPIDVMMAETDERPQRLGEIPTAGRGDSDALERAAERVGEAEEVTLVIGDGVCRAGEDAIEATVDFAEAAGARVHGEIVAAEISFPTDHEQWVSFLSANADTSREFVDTDLLVLAGCSTNTPISGSEDGFVPEGTDCIHLGADPWELGKNEPADTAIVGDPGEIMSELVPMIEARVDETERRRRLTGVEAVKRSLESGVEENPDDSRMSKGELIDTLVATAPDAYIVDESLTTKYAMFSRADMEPREWIGNKGGGLGYGLPASIGAALAESMRDTPRDVIGLIGDGSYLYYPQSIYTAVRYDIDLTVVIPDNRNYRILKDNTLSIMGGTEDDYEFIGMDFDPHVDIPTSARGHGAEAQLIESIDELEAGLERSRSSSGPTVLDTLVHD
jgi:benzoylformate decarboxylase